MKCCLSPIEWPFCGCRFPHYNSTAQEKESDTVTDFYVMPNPADNQWPVKKDVEAKAQLLTNVLGVKFLGFIQVNAPFAEPEVSYFVKAEDVDSLLNTISKRNDRSDDLAVAKDNWKRMRAERDLYKSELDSERILRKDADKACDIQGARIVELEEKNKALRSEVKSVHEDWRSFRVENERLQFELDVAQAKLNTAQNTLNTVRVKNATEGIKYASIDELLAGIKDRCW